jgi:TIR domain/NACHT domain
MINVFLSYSHKDEALQKELNEHLGALRRELIIETWWDRQIPIGNDWSEDIARELNAADLILLLVSSAFLDPTHCYNKELRRAIERHDAGDARVVPIILRACYWQPAPFAKLQGLPKDMIAVTAAPENKRDEVWAEVARNIHQAAIICSSHKRIGADGNTAVHATIDLRSSASKARCARLCRRDPRLLSGIRMLEPNYELTPGRRSLLRKLQNQLRPSQSQPLRIVTLQGQAGVGKSQTIAEWWTAHGDRAFKGNVFTLNCERKPGDQIVNALTAHFLHGQPGPIEKAVEAINAAVRPLIILDGLVKDLPQIPGSESQLLAPTDADSVALSSVRALLSELSRRAVSASVLLAIQTDRPDSDALRISSQLHAGVCFTIIPITPLSEEDGAHMLRRLGVRELSITDLKRISRQLMGLPISLQAAAAYLVDANLLEQEVFITQLTLDGAQSQSFADFFARYLTLLYRGRVEGEAHPHAFLRLLALMPGPVPKVLIETLLGHGRITRLQTATLESLLRHRLAFVADLGERLDLHPLARKLLRNELVRIVSGNGPADTTSRDELAWIHATAADYYLRQLPTSSRDFTTIEAETIEGAVHHLLWLRDLLPEDRQTSIAPGKLQDSERAVRERIISIQTTAGEITRFCFERIISRYFFNRDHHVTRFLGQFETKARILTYFLEGHSLTGMAKNLVGADWFRLVLEIGICWMHAGRLLIAERAVAAASKLCKTSAKVADSFLTTLSHDDEVRRTWMERSEAISTSCAVSIRLGRPADQVMSDIERDFRLAREIAYRLLSDQDPITNIATELSRAVRRLIGRRAHIELLLGDIESALDMFDLAVALERKFSGRDWLIGDVGRRHIQALVRSNAGDSGKIAQAQAILDCNIRNSTAERAGIRRQSNEIIPLLVTKSMLCRVNAMYPEAEKCCQDALEHPFVRLGECTFAARMELELESARIRIARGEAKESLTSTLQNLQRQLTEARHWMHVVECELLQSEIMPGQERETLLASCEIKARSAGWLLRCADILEIRQGRSAIKRFGC